MDAAHIAALLSPFLDEANGQRLTASDLSNISTYIDLLLRWNARINLTAIRDPEEIVTRHFGESFFAARHMFPKTSSVPSVVKDFSLADLGSGAGFPGLPIKLWAPPITLTLIESNQKKATFLREVIRAITLTSIDVFHGRAEDFPDDRADFVTLRAVERFNTVLPIADSLLSSGGKLALLIGNAQLEPAKKQLSNYAWSCVFVPQSSSRILAIGLKP